MVDITPNGVARIEIRGKGPLNVLDSGAAQRLTEAVRNVGAASDVQVLLLQGAGDRAFVGGADISEMCDLDKGGARAFIQDLRELNEAVRSCPMPVIALIKGWCLGAGMELATVCDLRIASRDARFGMPEVTVGIPSVLHASLLPRLIGASRAEWLLLTGATIDSSRAENWGLVHQVGAPEELHELAAQAVEQILRAGPGSVRLQKHLLRHWEAVWPDLALDYSTEVFASAYDTDEPRRLMERFLRRPKDTA